MERGALKDEKSIKIPKSQKSVPQDSKIRNDLKEKSKEYSARLSKDKVPDKGEIRDLASELLLDNSLGDEYLGFAMVQIGNHYFGEEYASIPFENRLLLLPHCLKDSNNCSGKFDQVQLQCDSCGKCVLDSFIKRAEELGYTVLIAEGTPIVIRILIEENIDGVLGVSCLTSLEKAFERVQESGIPAVAVPLLCEGCKDTEVDNQEVLEYLEMRSTKTITKRKKRNIDNLAKSIFSKALETYPEIKHETEYIARRYLEAGGKRIRPLLSVAVYSTLSTEEDLPDYIYNVALSIELFHKASLIHDDIEDESLFRYGQATLHTQSNNGVAINIGDFMLGLGYSHVIGIKPEVDNDIYSRILEIISHSHKSMGVGQGIELLWHLNKNKNITIAEVLDIYELKTAEAYKASILMGAVLAGAAEKTIDALERYSKAFGIAFQINDDLNDITLDNDGSLKSCPDIEHGKPTLIYAVALERLDGKAKKTLMKLISKKKRTNADIQKIYDLFVEMDALNAAQDILDRYIEEAEKARLEIEEEALKKILIKIKERAFE